MRVQAEVSLYPLRTATLMDAIDSFVGHLCRCGLEVEVGPMSSGLRGECKDLFRALGEAFEAAAHQGDVVVTVKITNACPEIGRMVPDGPKGHRTDPPDGT